MVSDFLPNVAQDERFQLTPDHDPEHIFPEELDMVATLRQRIPELKFYSDKWIVFFLCARRHVLDDVCCDLTFNTKYALNKRLLSRSFSTNT